MSDDFEIFFPDEASDEIGADARVVSASDSMSLEEVIEACIVSRIFFAESVLGVDLEPWQRKVLEELDAGETRISIRSGNGAGKTFLLAIIILHYILTRNDVKIPVTAPSSGQLKDGLIPETRKWMRRLPSFFADLLDTTQDRIVRKDSPDQNFVSFRTARKETPEALQGIHAEFVMCVVDEASAVPDEVYEAAQGTMSTAGSIFIMISNPTRLSGYFHMSQTKNRSEWRCHHVTAFDTSRVDQKFVDQIARDYGEQSDQYRVKVLGNFPSREENTLIGHDVVDAAIERAGVGSVYKPKRAPVWGVDVGRGGDLSAIVEREGHHLFGLDTQNYADTMQTAGWIKQKYDDAVIKPESIYVDAIGIGAGVADRLIELGLPCVAINVGESPSMKSQFVRMRDELWWNLKTYCESALGYIHCKNQRQADMILAEFCAPLQLFASTGKNAVETKAQMRSRGIKSPNLADAACLTFAYEGAITMGLQTSVSSAWKKPLDVPDHLGVW